MTATPSAADLSELTQFAEELADLSGKTILPHFRERIAVHNKLGDAGFDPVTEADRAAEDVIRARIKQRYPTHGVMGEEHGAERGSSPLTWVIDPIDGTRAFMCGMAQWGTLIALNDGQRPVIGILDQPYTRERWVACGGRSSFRDGSGRESELKTRPCPSLKAAVMSTTSPVGYFSDVEQKAFWALSGQARLTRFGGDCYAYGLLAMGFIDLIVESSLQPWDVQALIPIVENAGGLITTWTGGPAQNGGRVVACGDATLHAAVLEALGAVR
ncbi:MAG: histidinol-phosphatase [Alphaproteobacteria bacterium]|jgi:myo-inositol-1(or 4)-monophosphatase|nr:histidinol-phosphatase [Alphaproteobacteria bacterium]